MANDAHLIKVYTVKINRSLAKKNAWYFHRKGELFKCILVSKEVTYGISQPCFFVLGGDDGIVRVPRAYLTIRSLDCTIVFEETIDNSLIRHFADNYNQKTNEQREVN